MSEDTMINEHVREGIVLEWSGATDIDVLQSLFLQFAVNVYFRALNIL